MCICKSYNKQTGVMPEVVLPRPAFLKAGERINGVPVDACIAKVVQHLWDMGVVTLGSCCGHNTAPPSLVLGTDERDYKRIRVLIAEGDLRTWDLLQWRLIKGKELLGSVR